MNPLRVLLLTTLILLPASRLCAQAEADDYDSQVGVCNDGTILFSVARAYREAHAFSNDTWEVQGWYNVNPGKCTEIGPPKHYHNGGSFGKDAVTLLAIAFSDSTGAWGSIKLQGGDDRIWQPSNQQFCVTPSEAFGYFRDSSDLPRACAGKQAGYQMISATYEYSGPLGSWRAGFPSNHELHVKLDSSDRAIPLGPQSSNGGASQRSSSAGTSQSDGGASPSLCGKVSCWDLFLQGLNQAAKDDKAQKAAANAHNNPPPPRPPENNLPTSPQPAPADDPIGGGGFIAPPTSFTVLMCLPEDLARNSSWRPGSKMAAFQDMAGLYIASVAKPGWQYWISQAQYEKFDPARTASGDHFITAVSPDSGRFDQFDPKCPSGYEGWSLPVRH